MNQALLGMKVVISEDQPRYQLPADLLLPPGFRDEFNAWACGFLGTFNQLKDGEVICMQRAGVLMMNPRTFAQVRASLTKDFD
jgi:hypothetical protein